MLQANSVDKRLWLTYDQLWKNAERAAKEVLTKSSENVGHRRLNKKTAAKVRKTHLKQKTSHRTQAVIAKALRNARKGSTIVSSVWAARNSYMQACAAGRKACCKLDFDQSTTDCLESTTTVIFLKIYCGVKFQI